MRTEQIHSPVAVTVQHHHRDLHLGEPRQVGVADVRRADQDAGDAPLLEVAKDAKLLLGIGAGRTEHDRVALALRRRLHGRGDFADEGIGQGDDHQADDVGRLPVTRLRAAALMWKPRSRAMARTRSAVAVLISELPDSARETVEEETLAASAMSLIDVDREVEGEVERTAGVSRKRFHPLKRPLSP